MKKNILLIQPPTISSKVIFDYLKYPPMGLAFLASVLREHNYEPVIFYGSVVKNTFATLKHIIQKGGFEVIGVSFSSMVAEGAFETARQIKKINPKITVIAGGYHPTVMIKETLNNPDFDFVIYGEGEITLPELLEKIEGGACNFEKIKGLAFRKNGEIIINPQRPLMENLDDAPLPAYDLLRLDAYSSPSTTRKPYITYIRSRGCPFFCNFCGVQKMFSRKYRFESPQKTIANIDYLVKNFGVKEILFKDSEFVINKQSVTEFCDLLIEKKYDLVWGCNARVDMVSKELLRKMKEAGCNQITYGVESGDQNVLKRIKKGTNLEQAREAVKLTKETGIKCVTNFMFGNPEETENSMIKTIRFAGELDADYAVFNYLTAFPGSDIYDEALEKKWFVNGAPRSFNYESLKLNATQIPTKKLDKFLKKALISFYFRPKYILKRLKHISAGEIKNNFIGFWSIVRKMQ